MIAKPYEGNYGRWRDFMGMFCTMDRFKSEEEWRKARCGGLGASDAADVIGVGFNDNVTLWEEKCGVKKRTEPSEAIQKLMAKGKEAEAHIREMYAIDNDIDDMYDGTLVMLRSKAKPYMTCTLDSWYVKDGKPSILEIKRSESPKQFSEGLPMKYRAQLIHQMFVTGIERAVLCAYIKMPDYASSMSAMVKTFSLDMDLDRYIESDMEELVKREDAFWFSVVERTRPAKILPQI